LRAEIEQLRSKLLITKQEIEKMRNQNSSLKEQINASYQGLQEEIEELKEVLEGSKKSCLEEMKESETFFDKKFLDVIKRNLGESDLSEKLETLLQAQKEITKKNSDFC